ncbi:MAG: LysR family transcriptional regulator [Gammaproteobacteria bacterium]|nr:LysR family transcriptional regulator [Gammaproteobacteria bacterium]
MPGNNVQHDFNLLRSLEVFLAVAEQGQLTRAAAQLGISQSAVSQHLANLESLYATELLDRSLRPMQLTLTGQALQQHAREILRRVDAANLDLARIGQPQIPLLRACLLPSLATLLTPVVIEQTGGGGQMPTISLYADLASSHAHLIKSRQVDLVVTSQAFFDLDGLLRYPVLRESFLLVLPPRTQDFGADLAQLARELPLVRFSPSTPAGMLVEQHLRRCNLRIDRFYDADRTTMIMAAVAAGQGFGILSPTLLLDGLIEGMRVDLRPLPLRPLTRDIMLLHREGELGRLPRALADAARIRIADAVASQSPVLRDAIEFAPDPQS